MVVNKLNVSISSRGQEGEILKRINRREVVEEMHMRPQQWVAVGLRILEAVVGSYDGLGVKVVVVNSLVEFHMAMEVRVGEVIHNELKVEVVMNNELGVTAVEVEVEVEMHNELGVKAGEEMNTELVVVAVKEMAVASSAQEAEEAVQKVVEVEVLYMEVEVAGVVLYMEVVGEVNLVGEVENKPVLGGVVMGSNDREVAEEGNVVEVEESDEAVVGVEESDEAAVEVVSYNTN